MNRLFSLIATGVLFPSIIHAVSFDCSKASNWFEKAICRYPNLSRLDDNLSKTYKFALKYSKNQESLRKEQRQWLRELRETRKSSEISVCEDLFAERIEQLRTEFFPKKPGDCIDLQIEGKHGRLRATYDDTAIVELGFNFRIYASTASQIDNTFPAKKKYSKSDSKAYSDEYLNAVGNYILRSSDFVKGDRVKVCLEDLPKNCPAGDDRGKKYSITSYKRPEKMIRGSDSLHLCGGA
jgi:uncharacterized protein